MSLLGSVRPGGNNTEEATEVPSVIEEEEATDTPDTTVADVGAAIASEAPVTTSTITPETTSSTTSPATSPTAPPTTSSVASSTASPAISPTTTPTASNTTSPTTSPTTTSPTTITTTTPTPETTTTVMTAAAPELPPATLPSASPPPLPITKSLMESPRSSGAWSDPAPDPGLATETTSTDGWQTTETTPPTSTSDLTAILLGTLIPLAVIAIAIVAFLLWRSRKRRNAKPAQHRESVLKRRLSYHPVSVKDFRSQLHQRYLSGEMAQEFALLQEHSETVDATKTKDIGHSDANNSRNRFVDIVPYDDTLVMLKSPSGIPPSTYINASYVKGFSRHDTFIATQAPKKTTVCDFWNMILEQDSSVVVCLTNVLEEGRVKCFQYWPGANEMIPFDELTINNVSEVTDAAASLTIRKMEVMQDDSSSGPHVVTQYHVTSWASNNVPTTTRSMIDLCQTLIAQNNTAPVVVHCSTGVGRTGVFIAVLIAIRHIMERNAAEVDVASIVQRMREQRPKMVQTLEQYHFIYCCIRDFLESRSKSGSYGSLRGHDNKAMTLDV